MCSLPGTEPNRRKRHIISNPSTPQSLAFDSFELPESDILKDRFSLAHPHEDVDSVFREYRRFMELKVAVGDYDATQLSPSSLVDAMWHLHILDTRQYSAMCADLPSFIHHNPDGGKDAAARCIRYQTTLIAYRSRFGETAPSTIWPQNLYNTSTNPQNNTGIIPQHHNSTIIPLEAKSNKIIKLAVKDIDREVTIFKVKQHMKVRVLLPDLSKWKGVPIHDLRLLFDGQHMSYENTFCDYDLEDGDQLDLMPIQVGC